MEANLGSESFRLYAGNGNGNGGVVGRKKPFEWDLNEWKWDGELFVAAPLGGVNNAGSRLPSNSSSSSSGSEETGARLVVGKGNGEAEKRRRIASVQEEDGERFNGNGNGDGDASLSLTVPLANGEDMNASRNKPHGHGSSSGVLSCQVEGCMADLSSCKDYHRRHKVCETHAKASSAIVKNVIQRFCQQCSRFHLLQEFDEGKRSCRRRLAGHNRRRRKKCPDNPNGGTSLVDDKSSSYLLINLLRILSNLHSGLSENAKDQELLLQFLSSLGNLSGSLDVRNLPGQVQASQNPQNIGITAGTTADAANALLSNPISASQPANVPCSASQSQVACKTGVQGPQNLINSAASPLSNTNGTISSQEANVNKARLKDFDLNNTYSDTEGSGYACNHNESGAGTCPRVMRDDSRQSSPQHTSGNSDSTSGQSLSTSSGDTQCRTDRIVFKLFGKDPHDMPVSLRTQILAWLSNSPTDIESYIRPGCVILTVYLRLPESVWDMLFYSLSSSLGRLLNNSTSNFWRAGWIYASIQDQMAFIYNGHVVLDASLPVVYPDHSKILCVKPIAVAQSAKVDFTVKGFNLSQSATRILCSFEGRYLTPQPSEFLADVAALGGHDEGPEYLCFSCSLPDAVGRGFIEVEDQGLTNDFFPFIVAELDICSEICTLEGTIDIAMYEDYSEEIENTRSQALDFLNELGWLLRRSSIRSSSEKVEPSLDGFHLGRFRWLVSFAMDRDWCAVIKKLLDILFSGIVDLSGQSPRNIILSENLLHVAVQRNCRAMVDFLLHYTACEHPGDTCVEKLLFRPDMLGPCSVTPLHVAAASSGCEKVLDALTDDPDMLGMEAWKNACDDSGFTPEDYARMRGHQSYLDLVQKKINRKLEKSHVVVDIPDDACPQFDDAPKSSRISFEISPEKLRPATMPSCNRCSQQLAHQSFGTRALLYRPVMISMVAIAAVCVCVGILFKTAPTVNYVVPAFRWDLLGRGTI